MTVVVVSTGGTIAMRRDPATGALAPAASGAELLESIGADGLPGVELDEFVRLPSFDVHGEVALRLAVRVREHARRPDVDGVVVAHGTDTMEETVYTVDRLLEAETPVVLTGAQRGADAPDADGPRNLRDAIRVAASPAARGLGALIAFAGEIHAAREARKVHTSAVNAFASPGYGPLGHVDADRVTVGRSPRRAVPLPVPERMPTVDLIRLYAGADDRLFRASIASGAEAIVLEGTGRGNANRAVLAAVADAVETGIPVAVCSRCVEGRVEPVYAAGGGGRDLVGAGALLAGDLAGPKARVLLQLAIGSGLDPAAILAAEAG